MKITAILLLLFSLGVPSWAGARDATTEQFNVTAAEESLSAAKSDLDRLNEQIRAQKKLVQQEQARLRELQKQQGAAKKRYDMAKAHLAEQKKNLDQAWKQ